MIDKMAKVEILGLKDVTLDAIDAIHEMGTLHIEDLSEKVSHMEGKRVSRMEMDPKFTQHETTLGNLRSKVADTIQELKPPQEAVDKKEVKEAYDALWSDSVEVLVSNIEKLLAEVERSSRDPVERKADLMVELSRLEKYAPIMQKVQPLAERVARMENMASIALIIERKYKAILNYLNEEIAKITAGECEVISSDVDEESTAALVVFNRRFLKQVHEFLAVQDVNQVRLPSDIARLPIDEAVAQVRARVAEIPRELEEVNREIVELTEKYSSKLIAARNAIHDRLETMDAVPKFAQTDQVFIISGWLPEEAVEPMETCLAERFGNKVIMTVVDIREEHEEEETPVALRNNPFVRYFEIIYLLSKYPKYGTVDPTVIFAIFFPMLFGIMVGDIGYGAIIMLLGWLVHRKWKEKPLANMAGFIMMVGGAWSIVFGALYLECFGDLLARALGVIGPTGKVNYLVGSSTSYIRYPVDRIEGFTWMLVVCCAIGFIHISVGLVVGVVNGIREKSKKHIMEKAGTLGALLGLVFVIAKLIFKWVPAPIAGVGVVMFLVGIVFAGIGGGMGGVVESIVGAGNILSYARLIAIGLASVIMANMANDLSRQMWGGAFGIIIGVFVAVILHALNIVIAMFSPSIHALRLHLVESFGKFFEPAKYRYEPFRKTGGES